MELTNGVYAAELDHESGPQLIECCMEDEKPYFQCFGWDAGCDPKKILAGPWTTQEILLRMVTWPKLLAALKGLLKGRDLVLINPRFTPSKFRCRWCGRYCVASSIEPHPRFCEIDDCPGHKARALVDKA